MVVIDMVLSVLQLCRCHANVSAEGNGGAVGGGADGGNGVVAVIAAAAYVADGVKSAQRLPCVLFKDAAFLVHYNAAGAEKFTRYLGQWFTEQLQVTPKAGQDTELWRSRLDYITGLLEKPMTAA